MITNKYNYIVLFCLIFSISCTQKNGRDNKNSLKSNVVKSDIEWVLDEAKSDEFDS